MSHYIINYQAKPRKPIGFGLLFDPKKNSLELLSQWEGEIQLSLLKNGRPSSQSNIDDFNILEITEIKYLLIGLGLKDWLVLEVSDVGLKQTSKEGGVEYSLMYKAKRRVRLKSNQGDTQFHLPNYEQFLLEENGLYSESFAECVRGVEKDAWESYQGIELSLTEAAEAVARKYGAEGKVKITISNE